MLLVIDVGNTNTVIGVFNQEKLLKSWRIASRQDSTADEIYVLVKNLFDQENILIEKIKRLIISCVVPPLVPVLDIFYKEKLNIEKAYWVNADSVKGLMPVLYTKPDEIGADRIVNSIAAYNKYKESLIVIDFGTATTFDVISKKGEYLGGAISPGINISADALFQKASKLPRVALYNPPLSVIGKDTEASLKSGIIYGYAALIDGMVEKIQGEIKEKARVIATGGLAPLMQKTAKSIESVEKDLTLEGLFFLEQRFSSKK